MRVFGIDCGTEFTGYGVVEMDHAARDPILMAEAMQHAVLAGRQAFLAGRMARRLYATASSPLEGISK